MFILYPNGANVEDTPDPRRPKAKAVCCCLAAAIYMRTLDTALVYTRAGDSGILGFPQRWRIPTIGRDSPKEKA